MTKKYMTMFLLLVFLSPVSVAFADRGERREGRSNFYNQARTFDRQKGSRGEYSGRRLSGEFLPLLVKGMRLFYREGMYYRSTPQGYVVVSPPGYSVVVINPHFSPR